MQDLVRVLKSREDTQGARIQELEGVLRDWYDTFGNPDAELAAAGVRRGDGSNLPSAVARRLKEYHGAVLAMRAGVDTGRSRAERELADMRLALRDTGRVAREQAAAEVTRIRADADAAVRSERTARLAAEAALAEARTTIEAEARASAAAAIERAAAASREEAARARAAADAALRGTAAQREEAVASATALRAALDRERAAAAEAAAGARRDAEAARAAIGALQEQLAAAVHNGEARVRATSEELHGRLRDASERYERSVATARVTGMEREIAFLSARVRELQGMVDVMQTALHGGAAMLAALAPTSPGGTAPPPPPTLSPFDVNVAAPIGTVTKLAHVAHVGAPAAAGAAAGRRAASGTTAGGSPLATEMAYHVVRAGAGV